MSVLFHIADRHQWAIASADGSFTSSTIDLDLAEVGFIHLCTADQVAGVADRFYRGVTDLILLHVDETMLTATVVFEDVPGADEQFPHLYGPLNADAVVDVTDPFTV